MPNKTVKTLTVDNVTYDIKDETARNALAGKQDKLPTGTTGYFLKKTADGVEWAEGAAPGDDVTIKVNASTNKLYAVALKDARDTTLATNTKLWSGTKAQFNAIATKDDNTIYYVVDDTAKSQFLTNLDLQAMLQALYPVGSIYLGTQNSCPMATLIPGSSWEIVEAGRALWTGNGSNGNTKIAAGLPDHQHTVGAYGHYNGGAASYFYQESGNQWITLTSSWASESNAIYGKSSTVQPPAYVVNTWRRVA